MNSDGTLNSEKYNSLLDELLGASNVLKAKAGNGPVGGPEAMAVVAAAQKIINEVTPAPIKVLMDGFEGHTTGIMHTAIKMKVFQGVPQSSTITASELSKILNVDEELLHRIMRGLITKGYFKETDVRTYEHNTQSNLIGNTPLAAVYEHWFNDTISSSAHMHKYFAKNGWRNPSGLEDCPFTDLFGKNFWKIVKEEPERWRIFDIAMTAFREDITRESSGFNFARLKTDYQGNSEVAIVDVGGGRGHACKAYRNHFPELKDLRMIVQDLPEVVNAVPDSERTDDIEYQAHDFFTLQPIKKARAYYFSHILHDWNNEKCLEILKQTTAAMDENSRILFRETVIPNKDATRFMALKDINMLTIGSLERTESQWRNLLEAAGLHIESITDARDSTNASVIEAKLKI